MANVRVADATRDVMMDAFDTQCNLGTAAIITIYDGSQPANADAALTGTLLATLLADATMWGVSSNGVLTLASVADDTSAAATGTATHARILDQGGGAVVFDCDVGTSGTTIILNTVSIVIAGTVSITSGSMTFADA